MRIYVCYQGMLAIIPPGITKTYAHKISGINIVFSAGTPSGLLNYTTILCILILYSGWVCIIYIIHYLYWVSIHHLEWSF